jgi:hypothetical protein
MKASSKKTNTTSVQELKAETVNDKSVKKGYNEKNPTQPQGAFKPDNSSKKS